MRLSLAIGSLLVALNANGQTPTSKLLADLQTKREALPGLHQEFAVSQTFKTQRSTQGSRRDVIVDMWQKKWHEQTVSGAGDRIRLFDGEDSFLMEPGGDEYVRVKRKSKEDSPLPGPYESADLDWPRAKEVERKPCGFAENDHACVIVDVPVKRWTRIVTNSQITRMVDGMTRLAIDSETGVLVQSYTQENIDNGRGGYLFNLVFSLKKMSSGVPPDPGLFKLPDSGAHEVKQLTPWNVARIKKQLIGKQAPDLQVADLKGNPVSLSDLKGKTVLLDFWTSWCPPCLADAPVLDKLYSKYGGKELMIVGISVNEERGIVETFLKKHPHGFPIVLTSENEMPRPYEVAAFPTYIVIAPDGTLTTAVEGDQGFGELRKFLEKAGMETE